MQGSDTLIVNLRGTSGSGKSTLVRRYLDEHVHEPILTKLDSWRKEKIIAYRCFPKEIPGVNPENDLTYIIGRYETQCGGCDTLSYKGSHVDIENMVRMAAEKGNVIFEGLTISSTLTRWKNVSRDFPGQYVWAFMDTPLDVCYARILARSGREPKRDSSGKADYQRKFEGCARHIEALALEGELTTELSSDDAGYEKLVGILSGSLTLTH